MFLGNAENGEVVLAINPMWAERFGAAFPDVDDLQPFLHEHAWQPLDLWPEPNQVILRDKGRVGPADRVYLDRAARSRSSPSCAAGSAACTRSRSRASARARCRARPSRPVGLSVDTGAVADAVDEVGRILRADGADLLLVEADPKTLRIRLELRFDDVSCAECILAPDQLAETVQAAISRRVPGEFELVLDDPRR